MSVVVRRGLARFTAREAGRQTRHSFSFGPFYDPERVSFGPLVALNDDLLGRDAGYPEHEHSDLVIVTWVVTGCLEHTDPLGTTRQPAGQVAVTATGSGTTHSERAAGEVTRFVQMWLTPDASGGDLRREVGTPDLSAPGWVRVAGEGGLALGIAGARLDLADVAAGETIALPDAARAYVFVVSGALVRSSLAEPLAAGDAFELTEHGGRGLGVTAAVPTQLLAWSFDG
ncbi:pirin family protein [Nocardioides cynanchi]|uniref:pirin family protein n=1 Tax=Nocardioides cynanchi TaxID=2558918 RepID=UPI001246C769|nr:pirin family protein [Nocardioides cynanchi]